MPRLAIQFWVDAYVRRVERAGGYAAIVKKGNAQEGAVTICVRGADDAVDVYEPALVMGLDQDERRWSLSRSFSTREDSIAFDERLARQYARDPDMWVIEVTERNRTHFFAENELGA